MRTPKECIERLNALGVTKAEIARRIGVHRTNITHYVQGVEPTYVVVDQLRMLLRQREQEVKKTLFESEAGEVQK